MALRYEQGELSLALTRGDGVTFGEDVTANARVIPDVKKKLKEPVDYLEIRGEVYMKNEDFARVNEVQELNGKKPFANPRNCAAGRCASWTARLRKSADCPCSCLTSSRYGEWNLQPIHRDTSI